jgi:response regulator RpfG family c-di-GMP phosphodiesterase
MLELRTGRPRILVVDDEPEVRNLLADLLGDENDCSTTKSAEAALMKLDEAEFDLVITDIQMGGMSGFEMIPHVHAKWPDTIVLMVSGLQTIESAVEAMRVGAFDYILKPFDILKVEAAVRRGLEHHDLRVAKRRYENHLEELVMLRTAELDRTLQSLEEAYRSTLKALTSALEKRDSETSGHSERVVTFSLRLGREMGLSREQTSALEFGSLLHDIGKIGVPDAILRKPSKLTEDEWTEMRKHPLHGQQILNDIEFLKGAAYVVAQHHEKWDGSGYPLGLNGEAIDQNARIFAVADAFDAITSDRVYRKGQSYEAAAAELEEWSGRQFDPAVVRAFHRVPREEWDALRCESPDKSATEEAMSAPATAVASDAAPLMRPSSSLSVSPTLPLSL